MSFETDTLYNPLFLSELTHAFVKNYTSKSGKFPPFFLPYIAIPLVLQEEILSAIPSSTQKGMHAWVSENDELPEKVFRACAEHKKSVTTALHMSSGTNTILIDTEGFLRAQKRKFQEPTSENGKVMLKKSAFLGRWFAGYEENEIMMFLRVSL